MIVSLLAAAALAQAPVQDPAQARPEPMPTPRSIVLARGATVLTADGQLLDWPAVPAVRLDDTRQISGTALGASSGPRDLNAQAFLLWDDERLWFSAKVLDDVHVELTSDTPQLTEIPPSDAVVLTCDPRRDTRSFGADQGRGEDAAFWIGGIDGRAGAIRWDRLRGTARLADGAHVAVVRDEESSLTTYEVSIPWSEIFPDRTKPAVDDLLDLQIVVDDHDVPGAPMPETRIGWTFGTGARIDPGLFGTIRLSGRVAGDGREVPIPEFPAPSSLPEPPVPEPRYWVGLNERLAKAPPVVATQEHADPEFAGGEARHGLLVELDEHHSAFPRVDFLQFQMCIDRRMARETAGMSATGLPFYWGHVLGKLARAAQADAPERGFRLFRLPHGGWLVRSRTASFTIDAAGLGVEHELRERVDFALLTAANDITKCNDLQLVALTVVQPRREVVWHIEHGLPGLDEGAIPVMTPGTERKIAGLTVRALGNVDERGWVTSSVGYRVEWPDGSVLVVTGTDLTLDLLRDGEHPDVVLLSAKHPAAVVVGQRASARVTILDDVLQCATRPGAGGRVPVADAWILQRQLRPNTTLLLAPGESFDSEKAPARSGM